MANCIICFSNPVNGLSASHFSASSEVTTLPAENVGIPIIGKIWQASSTGTSAYLDIDFGINRYFKILAIAGLLPLTKEITIQHQLDANGGTPGTGAVYDDSSHAVTYYEDAHQYSIDVHILSSAQIARYWRITLSTTSSSTFGLGYAFVSGGLQLSDGNTFISADFLQPTGKNFSYGHTVTWQDHSNILIADRSGAEYVDQTYSQRLVQFQFNSMDDDDAEAMDMIDQRMGLRDPVLWIPDPSLAYATVNKQAIIGRLNEINPIEYSGRAVNWHSKAYSIREIK